MKQESFALGAGRAQQPSGNFTNPKRAFVEAWFRKAAEEREGSKDEEDKDQAPPAEPDKPPPPIGELPQPRTKEQLKSDKQAGSARDLKHRAKEASYNALELDNTRESHAVAAEAHRAAAKASEKALRGTEDPKSQAEFRASQHNHNLHAAYHDKMSRATDEERKASAAAGRNSNNNGKVNKVMLLKAAIAIPVPGGRRGGKPSDTESLEEHFKPRRKKREDKCMK